MSVLNRDAHFSHGNIHEFSLKRLKRPKRNCGMAIAILLWPFTFSPFESANDFCILRNVQKGVWSELGRGELKRAGEGGGSCLCSLPGGQCTRHWFA